MVAGLSWQAAGTDTGPEGIGQSGTAAAVSSPVAPPDIFGVDELLDRVHGAVEGPKQ